MFNRGVSIVSTGQAVPSKIRTNESIEKNAPTTAKWIEEKLGIFERRSAENQSVSDLGTLAAIDAINKSNISKDDMKRYYDFKKQQEDSKKGNRFGGKIKRKKKRLGGKITYNY